MEIEQISLPPVNELQVHEPPTNATVARQLRQHLPPGHGFERLGRRALGPRPARRVLLLALALTVLTRAPLFPLGLGIDEGGYSAVAAQWNPLHAGTSTYGNLFLDRPPLLLLLVKASLVFGDIGLRVLGLACALAIVSGVWLAARRLLGPTGAIIATPLAAVYASIAATGVLFTNAELVASSFGVWSVAVAAGVLPTLWRGTTSSLRARSPMRSLMLSGVLAGCSASCKQNFVDAGIAVLAALVAAVMVERRRVGGNGHSGIAEAHVAAASSASDPRVEVARTAIGPRHIAAFAAGGLAVLAAVLGWAALAGPGLAGMWEALIVFRADAASVISHTSAAPSQLRAVRLAAIAGGLGITPILLTVVTLQLRGFRRAPVLSTLIITWTIVATAGVVLGGSYFVHYLQQIAFPAALAAGYLARRVRLNRPLMHVLTLLTLSLVAALIAINASSAAVMVAKPYHVKEGDVGGWIHDHARPGDTIWVEYARSNLVHASRLRTPYPYMWSLMVRGRPNATAQLRGLLDSPQRPNWVVRWNVDNNWNLDPHHATAATVARNYTKVATVCGVVIMHDTATLATANIDMSHSLFHGCAHRKQRDVFGVID